MNRALRIFGFLVALLSFTEAAHAQLWSSVLDRSRATDWSQTGVTGGIPNRTTVCQLINPPASASAINTAIQNCSNNGGGVVQLGPGTFNLTSSVGFNASGGTSNSAQNVTLRGAGPDQTTLNFTGQGGASCDQGGLVCVTGGVRTQPVCNYAQNPNTANWTGPYAAGTTQITLDNKSANGGISNNLAAGMYITLDQLNSPSSAFNLNVPFALDGPNSLVNLPCNANRSGRCVGEWHKVTSISGTGPYTVTLAEPIAYQYWNSDGNNQPQAYWCESAAQMPMNDGIEDLAIVTNVAEPSMRGGIVQFHGAVQSWMKNVLVSYGPSASPGAQMVHVSIDQSAHIEVRDSYLYGLFNPVGCGVASTQYGVEPLTSGFVKVENNIFQQVCSAFLAQPCYVCVYGYNFTVGDLPQRLGSSPGTMAGTPYSFPSNFGHTGGTHLILAEGNDSIGVSPDHGVAHGLSPSIYTFFRNRFSGAQPSDPLGGAVPMPRIPADHQADNRFGNWIGNVLGDPRMVSLGWAYQARAGIEPSDPHNQSDTGVIFSIGWAHANGTSDDPRTVSTLMRWGNFDYVTNTVRCQTAEVPSGQFVPAVCASGMPASFYLLGKPSWFGSAAYPAIGPDVTGGTDASGHASNIPAKNCFLSVMKGPANGSGGVLTFNGKNCYGSSTNQTPPAPPTGLRVS